MSNPIKMRWPVTIEEVSNGYIVTLGRKKFIFHDWDSLSSEINAYAKGESTKLLEELTNSSLVNSCNEPDTLISSTDPSLADIERNAIADALLKVNSNREKAAKILDIGERTLYRKIKEYNL